ncbi:MAG: tetratricopeptide repeat protein [Gemmatimonadota bacterium]|nr:MAG: tetratricopeptide repeat protein [Gemmatimonadota bacterium]
MKPFLAELKRRKVVRVAIVYVVVGLVVVEAANNLFPALNLPDWTVTLVVALAILGFPVSVALAWAFDITTQGVRRTGPLQSAEEEMPSAAVAARPVPERPDDLKSIAVLPFADMSPEGDQEYLGDGIAEEVLNVLALLPDLHVAARTSSFAFKGKGRSIQEIGRELGVATVLEGSVRKAGNRLRITAQLTQVADGYHLWSQTYQQEMEDVFAIQDEIARAIVDTLRVKLLGEQDRPLVKAATKSPEAYDLYLKGRHYWYRRYKVGLQTALEYFERAVEADPDYAPPYTGIADVHTVLGIYGLLPPDQARGKARAAAEKALALDPELAEAHFSESLVLFYRGDYDDAERALQRAIELNPNYAKAHVWWALQFTTVGIRRDEALAEVERARTLAPDSAYISACAGLARAWTGRYEDAIQDFERVLEQEPESIIGLYGVGCSYSAVRRHEEAIAALEKAASLANRIPVILGLLGSAYGRAGMEREARAVIEELEGRSERGYVSPVALASIYATVGRPDDAFRYLEAAVAEFSPAMANGIRYAFWEPIQSDPRFGALLGRMGLVP